VLVGDGVWDVAAAQALALPFVGRAGASRAEELRARGAGTVLPDLTSMDAVLSAFETATVPR
jgi:phosphoglycolate phosphatase-like HAD superfamily hydrolase